jgi:hypothetical protein
MSATKKKPKSGNTQRAADIIRENPTRRSRAERALVQLTTTSYPHYLIGNIVAGLHAGEENVSKQALDIENKFGILDFVRELTLTAGETTVAFDVGTIRIDQNTTRVDNQLAGELIKHATFTSPVAGVANLAKDETFARNLIDVFHRNQVRGMTRVHAITNPHWKLVEKRLTTGNDNGFGGLGRSETVFEITSDDAAALIRKTLGGALFSLILGADIITIVEGEVTKEITFVVPPRK